MNQVEAFKETLALAEERDMPLMPGTDIGLEHLREMWGRVSSDDNPQASGEGFSDAKLGRWLGWAQCAVVASGVATLDDMKAINKPPSPHQWKGKQ